MPTPASIIDRARHHIRCDIIISNRELLDLMEMDGGFCLHCGEEAYGIEGDAVGYTCEMCGHETVMGIDVMLEMGYITLTGGK